jgi:hypothetical protein
MSLTRDIDHCTNERASLLVTRARPLFTRFGLTWPSELASVAARRLHYCLGVDTQGWLH